MHIDESAWPLVITTLPPIPTLATIDELAASFEAYLDRGEPFAVITDTRPLQGIPDALWRKRLTDWLGEPAFRDRNRRWVVGAATVVSSTPVRAALTALHWLWKPPTPQHYAADMPEAVAWCVKQLEAVRVPIPASLRALEASLGGASR